MNRALQMCLEDTTYEHETFKWRSTLVPSQHRITDGRIYVIQELKWHEANRLIFRKPANRSFIVSIYEQKIITVANSDVRLRLFAVAQRVVIYMIFIRFTIRMHAYLQSTHTKLSEIDDAEKNIGLKSDGTISFLDQIAV